MQTFFVKPGAIINKDELKKVQEGQCKEDKIRHKTRLGINNDFESVIYNENCKYHMNTNRCPSSSCKMYKRPAMVLPSKSKFRFHNSILSKLGKKNLIL